ncbi:peptidylprolyl isomerase [Virgibacillus soli]|uniref:Foldase protein PrsA n=1 Tax=Paracerasibacillus soli TaxID=480284 RepID=A0ABU5CV64_9BACI|nr:peptidylprolyl isomerase [Virgibacillus soli]MDY0409298.1 peptidylprolyl isomerase [Virgibacillus soli]
MKKRLIAMTTILILFSLGACSGNKDEANVIIETRVGTITEDDLNEELQKRYGESVLQELVTIDVLSSGYDIDEKKIDEELNKVKEELGMQFDMYLQQQGLNDEDAFKSKIYLGLLQEAAALDGVDVSDSELKEAYDQKTKEISAQHILVKDEETALEMIESLEDGIDFSELAKEYSEDKVSAKDGGDLGYFSVGTMIPAFEHVAFSMKKGEVSEPVQTNYGYHIIKLNDIRKKDREIASFEEMKEALREEIRYNKINMVETQGKIEKMIRDAIVDVKDETYKELFNDLKANKTEARK